MRIDFDELLNQTVPELARLWATDPPAALRRSMELQRAALDVALESVEQALELTRLAGLRATRAWEQLGRKAAPSAPGGQA
jgi:hypothetical protein